MKTNRDVSRSYNRAVRLCNQRVELEARKVLLKHLNLKEFIKAMGRWIFTDQKGNIIYDGHLDKRFKRVERIISRWDEYLKLTGDPVRFTAKGPRVTDW